MAQPGSALDWGSRGRRFDSGRSDQPPFADIQPKKDARSGATLASEWSSYRRLLQSPSGRGGAITVSRRRFDCGARALSRMRRGCNTNVNGSDNPGRAKRSTASDCALISLSSTVGTVHAYLFSATRVSLPSACSPIPVTGRRVAPSETRKLRGSAIIAEPLLSAYKEGDGTTDRKACRCQSWSST